MRKIYNFINGLEVLHLIGTYEKTDQEEEEIYVRDFPTLFLIPMLVLFYKNVVILMHATIFFLKVGLFFINRFLFFYPCHAWPCHKKISFLKF